MTSADTSRFDRARPGRLRRFLKYIVLAVIAVLLLPYLVAPLYRFIDPVSTLMVWRWVRGYPVQRTFVPLAEMPPVLPLSVIGSEDARFCTHSGIDWQEVRNAIGDADDLSDARGGSTITQQVAKNLFLWPGRSLVRKGLEAPLALWTDLVLPKRRVLEIYLNVAEWGPGGQFGAEAGARRAFNKSVRNVNVQESALMAAVLPNPFRRSARQPGPGVRRLAATIQARAASAPQIASCVRGSRPP